MAIDSDKNWHKTEADNIHNDRKVIRDHFKELSVWAEKNQISGIFDAVAPASSTSIYLLRRLLRLWIVIER